MQQFRVKGLTCANCTLELEQQIQKLEHGQDATLSYNSGKLTLQGKVSLEKVAKILSSEGAYIEQTRESHAHDHGHDHSHDNHGHSHAHENHHSSHEEDDHSHSHGGSQKWLIGSAVIFVAAWLLRNELAEYIIITIYIAVMIVSGYRTWIKGLKNLLHFRFNIDTLMTIALAGAVGIGQWEEAALVALLFGLNELLEGMGMDKARRSMRDLLEVAPKEAMILKGNTEALIPIGSLVIGDTVIVRPGEKIPSDGTVLEGRGSVNEAVISGESLPVDKFSGEPVFGGSLNNEGVLKITITKAYKDSSLARILHLVEEAQETKTPTQLFINRFAFYYTPIIMAIALLTVIVPPLLFESSWVSSLYQGLAVLIVGCPCALILASPIAIVAGITRNARNGILIKGGVFLEQLGKINTIAFDKTGTLTVGVPTVEQVIAYDEKQLYSITAALERNSSHPLALAIMKRIESEAIERLDANDVKALPGMGVTATIQDLPYWIGNEKSIQHILLSEKVQNDIKQMKQKAFTIVLVVDATAVLGIFGITDPIREESRSVIAKLHRLGIRETVMLTGDHSIIADKVAKIIGIKQVYANLLPEQKVEQVKKLAQKGHVAMIGDGINDAPALATAQLGIAMGKGTDSAMETADIILLQDHLGKLPEAITIAKSVNRLIKINISIALGLKIIALLLTIPGLLTLWIAILSDMGATVLVSLLSLTLLIQRKSHKTDNTSR
ncbi:cadmium-translocating P-type ATPase [Paenibacillus psychroresistens]|uniref:Cd(2+)-exporting ATPase n=1 Tax=Paenibacillus psychroresistens TaxID=1778678 RepID=A0A6B8RQC7_9BACL|nr:cation-translocating P-type ATPase [Paenibacillus psychroresistens]QGQ98004.1 cadmium-translocating P-type ATPase [Paenibacillus psychroresistens]